MSRSFHEVRSISSSGSGVVRLRFPRLEGRSGRVVAWLVRLSSGSATALRPVLTDHNSLSDAASEPPAEYRVAAEDTLALTVSSTEASFQTAFVHPMPFEDGLRFLGAVTATGAFTLVVSVWGEVDE